MRRDFPPHNDSVNTITIAKERLPFERADAPDLPVPFRTVIPHAVAITRLRPATTGRFEPRSAALWMHRLLWLACPQGHRTKFVPRL